MAVHVTRGSPVADPAEEVSSALGRPPDESAVRRSTRTPRARERYCDDDVYALYYNWLQIKDGRALLSFA